MDNDTVIQVDGISKKFCRSLKRSMWYGFMDILRDTAGITPKSDHLRNKEFWAVDNVSFKLKRGETLGLIGANGAGKSTILKMLNGIILPDAGNIKIRGRIGALIQVGAGFHPQLTGRENIYINGSILGMSKREIDKKFDAIVDFADIGDFLDTPVKHYSSGMFVRLGFAVAVHCEPDILLIDEVLAVGDKDFQIKCYQKIHEIKKIGTTIILVSHNEYTIREQTKKCLYLHHGRIKFLGSSEEGISLYIKETLENQPRESTVGEKNKTQLSKKAEITSLDFYDQNWNKVSFIKTGEELNIVLECIIREELNNPIFGVHFYDNSGFMYCANSDYENVNIEKLPLGGKVKIIINIPHLHLPTNNYLCSTLIAEESVSNLIDCEYRVHRFVVGRAKNARGSIKLPTKWEIERL